MKKKILAFLLCLITLLVSNLKAQDISGTWNGVLDVMGTQLAMVFHIHVTDSGYTATLDSPDQGAMNIPFSSVDFADGTLTLTAGNIGAMYTGIQEGDSIAGTWNLFSR